MMTRLRLLTAAVCLPLLSCASNEPDIPGNGEPVKTIDLLGYDLIFADEFNGTALDWSVWESSNPSEIKNETSRGRETVEMGDGVLRLNVRKAKKNKKAKWEACYVYMREPLPHNVYLECRFKSGECSGVNNSFWLACKVPPNNNYMNKYEIDIVEARKDARNGKGRGNIAWHDWKTYQYARDKEGNPVDIAQGTYVEHDFSKYHVWGLWYGENELIYYLDGEEIWRGKTSPLYPDQYYTGVGKAPKWYTNEQGRAYGNYGQDDWNYSGGYNGDVMNVVLANLPWGESWSPLVDEEADGTAMLVDYVRIYRPKYLGVTTPDTDSSPAEEIRLGKSFSMASDGNYYFSAVIDKKAGEELNLDLLDPSSSLMGKVIVDANGHLLTGITRLTSSEIAYSPYRGAKLVADGEPTLLVVRLTCHSGSGIYDKDAISVWTLPLDKTQQCEEPYFYPNIDDYGNTSQTQGWYVNQKGYSSEVIGSVRLGSSLGKLDSFGRFRAGSTFNSVVR